MSRTIFAAAVAAATLLAPFASDAASTPEQRKKYESMRWIDKKTKQEDPPRSLADVLRCDTDFNAYSDDPVPKVYDREMPRCMDARGWSRVDHN